MVHSPNHGWLAVGGALGAAGLAALLLAGGCVAIADIGDIEIGTTSAGGGGVGGTGAGGTGAGTTGGGGAGPTCSDGTQNGEETGVDCGGPSCPACSEDCTNGVDDDGNNLVDCADTLCSGYHCAPEAPQGWEGPSALYLGTQGEPLPSCDVAWPTSVSGGSGTLDAPAAQCTACGCDPPANAVCVPPTLDIWTSPACPGSPTASVTIPAFDHCEEFGGNSNDSAIASAISVSGGDCDATGGVATVDPGTWSSPALLCGSATVGAGCSENGQVCVRQPESPFQTSVCVSQDGDVDCPPEHYTDKHLVVFDLVDSRDCSDCSCGTPTGMICTGTTTVSTNQSCSQNPVNVPNDGVTCTEAPGLKSVRTILTSGPDGGSCAADGGVATGSAVAGSSTTVCCLPE